MHIRILWPKVVWEQTKSPHVVVDLYTLFKQSKSLVTKKKKKNLAIGISEYYLNKHLIRTCHDLAMYSLIAIVDKGNPERVMIYNLVPNSAIAVHHDHEY